jgi:hypothetical protein
MQIMLVAMSGSGITVDGVEGDLAPDEPVCFAVPYYPKTMKIVEHLTGLGYLKLHYTSKRGSAYDILFPIEKTKRGEWTQSVLTAIQGFMMAGAKQAVRDSLDSLPPEDKWKKEHVELVTDSYRQKFPEDVPDCLVCHTEHTGTRYSVQKLADSDPRLSPAMREAGVIPLFAFGLCPTCYELPDVESRVMQAVVDTERIRC